MMTIIGVPRSTNAPLSESEFVDVNKSIQPILDGELKKIKDHKWKVPLTDGEVEVTEVMDKFVDVVALVQDFVGQGLSSNPYGALAWTSVCFGIQVKH